MKLKKITFLLILTILSISIFAAVRSVHANPELQEAQDLQKKVYKKLENNVDYLNFAKDLSRENRKNLEEESAKHDEELKSLSDQSFKKSSSTQYQANIDQIFRQINPTLNLEELQNSYKEQQHLHLNQLMIFVSSSMPINALKEYAIQSKKAGAVLVLRGLIDNSLKKTANFIYALNKEGTRAIIDPLAYKNFNITQIPQIVVVVDNHGCKWGRCNHTPLHDKISGNIDLEYALTEISKKGEFTKEEASRFLTKLRDI